MEKIAQNKVNDDNKNTYTILDFWCHFLDLVVILFLVKEKFITKMLQLVVNYYKKKYYIKLNLWIMDSCILK